MSKHIVFTGPDGAGKTSQLQRFAQMLTGYRGTRVVVNRAVRYNTAYEKQLPTIFMHLLDYIGEDDRPNTFVLHDRWNYPEELIYPKVLFGAITPLGQAREEIEKKINSLGDRVFFVIFNAPASVLSERMQSRTNDEDYVDPVKHLHSLSQEYAAFHQFTTIKNKLYVYDEGKQEKEVIFRDMVDELIAKGVFK